MTATERVQAIVIGGGVVGCAVLRELAQHGIEALLLEAEPSTCEGTSKANSAIVHSGFDARPGTVEAAMLRRAAELWPALVDELGLPFLEVGALMLSRNVGDSERLAEVSGEAAALGVATEMLDRAAVADLAPYLAEDVRGALSIPAEAVTDPFWLTRRLAEAGMAAGGQVWTNARVAGLEFSADAIVARLEDGRTVRGEQVLNCAGLWADEVAALAGDTSFGITPRRGQFLISEEPFGVDRIVLPLPGEMGKGMLVTPIVFGGVLLGPTAEDIEDKGDRSTDAAARDAILASCSRMVPAVADMLPIRQFAGLRAVSSTGDYILRPSASVDRLYHVTGIRSTGISASPAIAEHVVAHVSEQRGWRAGRSAAPAPDAELAFDEEAGAVVCICRSVSAAEVRAAVRHPLRATTLDAAKRACGTTFGDCQGNLCAVASAQLLATSLGSVPEAVLKHRDGSWLFLPAASGPAVRAERQPAARPDPHAADVVVIGGGLAGIGAALEAIDVGMRPLVVERTLRWGGAMARLGEQLTGTECAAIEEFERAIADGSVTGWLDATASGLAQDARGWTVSIGDDAEVSVPLVVLACGGYLEPREHRAIAGPRPSGVATADLVHAALDVGLLPGRRGVLVGSGRLAEGTAARMEAAGMAVQRIHEPSELRGDRRLQAVRVDGDWQDADLLVLADRLLPAPFLLRPLGLVDNRPGSPAPAAPDGRTDLAGLWAAGTCRLADVDHRRSVEDGRAVMRAAAATRGAPV